MEDRYGDKVIDEVLNLVAGPDRRTRFLTSDDKPLKPGSFDSGKSLIVHGETVQSMTADDLKSYQFWPSGRNVSIYKLQTVDATTFGTREEIDADRRFLARYNFAQAIQREADREYKDTQEAIRQWLSERITANLPELLRYAHCDKFYRVTTSRGFTTTGKALKYLFAATGMIHPTKKQRDDHDTITWGRYGAALVECPKTDRSNWAYPPCYLNDCRAFWYTAIKPRTADDLAYMCGVSVDELPEVLRNWRHRDEEPYVGNPILSRIDPLEWALTTPWEKEDFLVRIYLSKRGRSRVQKEYEPPEQVSSGDEQGVPMIVRWS